MSIRTTLWGLSMGCAALLLYAPLTPRTTWVATSRAAGGGTITEGVGWQGIAVVVGIVAIIALLTAVFAQRRAISAVATAVATVGFVIIAVGMRRHAIDLANGVTSVNPGPGWAFSPAPQISLFADIATGGAICVAALALCWLQLVWSDLGE